MEIFFSKRNLRDLVVHTLKRLTLKTRAQFFFRINMALD